MASGSPWPTIHTERAALADDLTTQGVHALWPKKLYPKLHADGPLTIEALADLHQRHATALHPARTTRGDNRTQGSRGGRTQVKQFVAGGSLVRVSPMP